MNQQPDKLFRERMENFELKVSANAWSRVDANVNKKNKSALWLKIAASLLVIAVSTFVFLSRTSTEKDVVSIAEKSKAKDVIRTVPQAASRVPTAEEKKVVKKSSTRKANQHEAPSKTTMPALKHTPSAPEQVTEVPINEVTTVVAETVPTPTENPSEVVVAESQPVTQSRISIVISAAEADEKYLDKNSLADATPDEKKTSTLKKLIDTAYDLKNNQDPFGDLRQKKNEILALNFKSEKQRSQNK